MTALLFGADDGIGLRTGGPGDVELPPTTYVAGGAGRSWLFVVITGDTAGMRTVSLPLVID